jgi:hypothetical protein
MRILRVSLFVLIASICCTAQQKIAPSSDASTFGTNSTTSIPEGRAQLESLRRLRRALADYLANVPQGSEEYRTTKTRLEEADARLQLLSRTAPDATPATPSTTATPNAFPTGSIHPEFSLAVPRTGRTNISQETTLTWTEDRRNGAFQNPPLYELKRFRVVIAKDEALEEIVHEEDNVAPRSDRVTASGLAPTGVQSIATSYAVPEGTLEAGTRYYWQVFAVYVPRDQSNGVELQQKADGRPAYFITTLDPFRPLTKRNFSLQRSVASTDPTEGAQFSFLKTFDKKTVFSTDFALFWDSASKRFAGNRGFIWFRPAVEGKLTSDDSLAEDAWRFSGSAVVDYNFIELDTDQHNRVTTGTNLAAPRRFIDSLYFELGANLESDQGFNTKKLASRVFFSPSSRLLAIGTATGDIDSPVQFIWRPSVEFNGGHTFEVGDSAEIGNTVLRVMPKVRMTLYTRSLSRYLKIANSDFFLDNTFYYLPKERFKTKHNFFTAGFELFVVKNFGFGLTYKNGESAPKFKMVRSFGGTLTVRFGPQ